MSKSSLHHEEKEQEEESAISDQVDHEENGEEEDDDDDAHRSVSPMQRLSVLHRYQDTAVALGLPDSMTPGPFQTILSDQRQPQRRTTRLQRLRNKSDNILFRDRATIGLQEASMPPTPNYTVDARGVFQDEDYVNDS